MKAPAFSLSLLVLLASGCGSTPAATEAELVASPTAQVVQTDPAVQPAVSAVQANLAALASEPLPTSTPAPPGCGDDYIPTDENFELCRPHLATMAKELEARIAELDRMQAQMDELHRSVKELSRISQLDRH